MSEYKGFSFTDNIDFLKNIQLQASAGTGKTYSIERIVTLLIAKSSLSISRILVVTFTKKAARELKERIRDILSLTLHSREIDLGDFKISLNEEELEHIQKSYLEFEKASILTIHSFCLNMLKAYPFESLSQFSMEMESESDLAEEAVWDYMREIGQSMDRGQLLKYKAYLEGKTFEEAVSGLSAAVNRELLEPQVELIPDRDFISDILSAVMDFNNKKGELYQKWNSLYSQLPDKDKLDELGFSYTKNKIKKLSIISQIPSDTDFISINKILCKEKIVETLIRFLPENLEYNLKKGINTAYVKTDNFVQAVEDFLHVYLYDEGNPGNNLYRQALKASFLFEAYEKIKNRLSRKKDITGKLDFNDLIGKLHRALCGTEKFIQPQLIQEIQKRYRTVLVDEFQDTDNRQWDIFRTLFGNDDEHNFFLVGDPKQSIYGFRGADLEIYYRATNGDSVKERFTLDKNYRSVADLVTAVNVLFTGIFDKEMHCGFTVKTPFSNVQAGKDNESKLGDQKAATEFIRIESILDPEKGFSNLKQSKELYFKLIAYKVFDLLDRGTILKNKTVRPGDIALLTESNKDCQVLQNLLTSYAIPSVITAREKIFETVEASEFLIFLQALVRMDNSSIKLLLLSIFFEFSPHQVEEFELNGTLDLFSGQIYHWRDSIDQGHLIEVCSELFDYKEFPGLEKTFEQRLLSRKNGERAYTNIRQILEFLHKEQHSSRLDTEELYSLFQNKISRSAGGEDDLLRLDKDSEAVQIMTMHASKGLEFPIVFFAGALKKDMKSSVNDMYNFVSDNKRYYDFLKYEKNKNSQSMDLWEERKRLYYVAFTRASSKLYLPFIQNCDFSYLSSLYSSFSIEKIKRILNDQKHVEFFSLPIHSGLKINSTNKGELKKSVLNSIDDSIFTLVEQNSDFFTVNSDLESEYINSGNNKNLIFSESKEPVKLQFHDLKSSTGFISRYKRVSSYSSIIRDKAVFYHESNTSDDADRDDVISSVNDISSGEILTRGAVLGELVHLLFEQLDYSKVEDLSLSEFSRDDEVDNLCKTHSVRFFNNKWYVKFSRQLKELLFKTLKNEILPGFSLSRLTEKDKLHEIEFHMTVKECEELSLGYFSGSVEEGYIKGFIDLVFKYKGKYYVADWKTTSSPEGNLYENYHTEVLEQIMESHHYNLQSMIYMVALCQFMNSTAGESFDYDRDFGGCFYFFVRGMNGEKESDLGIHYYRPEKEALISFARQFSRQELQL
ncbi:MAG: UvrD-helicase domain-containing protein [Spirochaetaceae bacterium]|jgi:exodeoxyribonuclease V beta subunit|nr:UvrD-helicase domain-containing protein [Spirochaetaceae bacterium]